MAGGNEHFCLRWNDFESNISHAFREIREEKDFFDVTLACEDEQIQAHKVILSACSPFFRKILKKNPHQHPLLFLKGVKYTEIVAILNFMYHGEVNVTQDDLNTFLAVAEELKVKGLTQGDQQSKPKPPPAPRRAREPPDEPAPPNKRPRVVAEVEEQRTTVKTEAAEVVLDEEEAYSRGAMVAQGSTDGLEGFEEGGYEYPGYEEEPAAAFDASSSHAARPDGNKGGLQVASSAGSQNPEELVYFERDPAPGSRKNWRCRLCGEYSHNKGNAMNHVEAKHIAVSYSCEICSKEFRSRNSWKTHKSVYHSSQATAKAVANSAGDWY